MLRVGDLNLNSDDPDPEQQDSTYLKYAKSSFKLNFDWEKLRKDFAHINRYKLNLRALDGSLYLVLNAKRTIQYDDPKLIKLYNELFCDFNEALERHPSLEVTPCLEDKELTPEETATFLSFFNSHRVDSDTDVQHPDLLPELRPYQEDAVRWLLHREKTRGEFTEERFETIHSRYCENQEFFIYLTSLEIHEIKPQKCFLSPGGILADEMGLGKTVEMLALFLYHPNPNPKNTMPMILEDELPLKRQKVLRCICGSTMPTKQIECLNCGTSSHIWCVARKSSTKTRENYICPECWDLQENLDCNTTLIVSPTSIQNQWRSEIQRHISKPLKILMYHRITNRKYISPLDLIQYDIVITDYGTLGSEVYFDVDNSCHMNRRNESRSMRLLSPLAKVNWWRICMDEAQMVSSTCTKAYKMINRLSCVNKWAVTGTPIHKSIDDLSVHMNLFDVFPLSEGPNFRRLFYEYRSGINNTLVEYLQKFMWRTSKDQVKEQLDLPESKEIVHFVTFTNIMTFFYEEQRQKYTDQFFQEAKFLKSTLVRDIEKSRVIKVSVLIFWALRER